MFTVPRGCYGDCRARVGCAIDAGIGVLLQHHVVAYERRGNHFCSCGKSSGEEEREDDGYSFHVNRYVQIN